jgi:nicotinamidase-related amidase
VPDLERESQGLGKRPALLIVDIINSFTDPDCPLGSEAGAVVEANRQLLQAFRDKQLPVVFTNVVYHEQSQARVFRDRVPALDILEPGTHWVEVDPRLEPRSDEPVFEKQWASGFFKTGLNGYLEEQGVDSLVITGLTTSGCVRATAVDGLQHDYKVVIPAEAVGDRNEDAHRANLFDLNAKYADVLNLNSVLKMIENL